ncbi:GGDEF domain-containing protein [Pseudomonas sp. LA5]|uniref:GGDEF domain-containing protein n=1 Tax=Pseudomonas sp. LA5 TaxID=3027850 RepID=UPI00236276EA|nr:GGDEF domain-containing protein [Pseudomonas sp. LA5]
MDDDIRYEQHVRRVLRTPLLVLQPLMLAMWPLSLWSNPLIGSPYKARYFALMLLLLGISALLSVARSARMMSLTFTGNIWALILAFRIQIQDGGALGHYWNLPIAIVVVLGTCGLTYRLSHYLITLAGAAFILFAGQAQLIPAAMPVQLVGLLVGATLAIGIAYNHANSQWMRRTFILKERYRILAETDELTGIANRRKLLERVDAARGESGQAPRHFVMLDIDNFKEINDRHGHQVGDQVLFATARQLDQLDPRLQGGRLGGEEFGLLIRDLDEARVSQLLETLRRRLAEAEPLGIRFSAGALRLTPELSLNELLRQADEGLYRAKRQGKDQTVWIR